VSTATRVVLLQHPREARLAICSAWLTRLALENAELHRGLAFERDAGVMEQASRPGAALLYPGPDATPIAQLCAEPPPVLIVLDGTWLQAEKMLAANPKVASLRRVSFGPTPPSGYRQLRREPAPHCLSTLEAVATALTDLEGRPERFAPMRAAFERMVELQLACSRDGRRSPRHRMSRCDRQLACSAGASACTRGRAA
jgi:DTW domain-containing protein YfiP